MKQIRFIKFMMKHDANRGGRIRFDKSFGRIVSRKGVDKSWKSGTKVFKYLYRGNSGPPSFRGLGKLRGNLTSPNLRLPLSVIFRDPSCRRLNK